jgi:alanyl-tRNA synthetase
LVTEETPFHPIDHRWPDQPGDSGSVETCETLLPVLDTITAASPQKSETLHLGQDIPVPRAALGWTWLVVHIARVPADGVLRPVDLVGKDVILKVDEDRRRNLNASHTASHLFSFAFNQTTRRFWKGLAAKFDSLRNPDLDQLSIQSSRITEKESVDHYRFGKTVSRSGFHSAGLLEVLDDIQTQVNETMNEWIRLGGRARIEAPSLQLEARRQWICELHVGTARMACGGTHLERLNQLASTRVTFEKSPGLPEIKVHTQPELKK